MAIAHSVGMEVWVRKRKYVDASIKVYVQQVVDAGMTTDAKDAENSAMESTYAEISRTQAAMPEIHQVLVDRLEQE